jgi:hypothetical protein
VPSQELKCDILAVLMHGHFYGSNHISESDLVRRASGDVDNDKVRDALEEVSECVFVDVRLGNRVRINNTHFGSFAQYMYDRCGYDLPTLKVRLHHFEGWDELDL